MVVWKTPAGAVESWRAVEAAFLSWINTSCNWTTPVPHLHMIQTSRHVLFCFLFVMIFANCCQLWTHKYIVFLIHIITRHLWNQAQYWFPIKLRPGTQTAFSLLGKERKGMMRSVSTAALSAKWRAGKKKGLERSWRSTYNLLLQFCESVS